MTKTHSGWVTFAGVMLFIAGVLNVIYGIAAIGDSKFFIQDQKYILSNLNTWGWVTLHHRRAAALRRLLALGGRALRPLRGHSGRQPQRIRRAAVNPRVPVLVARHLRHRHHRHLPGRDVRRRGLRGRAEEPGEDPGGAEGPGDLGGLELATHVAPQRGCPSRSRISLTNRRGRESTHVWIRTCPRFGPAGSASSAVGPGRAGNRKPAHPDLGPGRLGQDGAAARLDGGDRTARVDRACRACR